MLEPYYPPCGRGPSVFNSILASFLAQRGKKGVRRGHKPPTFLFHFKTSHKDSRNIPLKNQHISKLMWLWLPNVYSFRQMFISLPSIFRVRAARLNSVLNTRSRQDEALLRSPIFCQAFFFFLWIYYIFNMNMETLNNTFNLIMSNLELLHFNLETIFRQMLHHLH